MFSCVRTKTNTNFATKLAERSNHSSFSAYLMKKLFLNMCQWNVHSLFDRADEIFKITRILNINKAHDYDISTRMIKICDKSLLKPLILLFQNSTKLSYNQDIWKRYNIQGCKQRLVNGQLLPIFSLWPTIFIM